MSAFQTAQFYELLGNRGGRLEREGPFLREALDRAPARRAADVACGLGLHAHWLAEQDAEVDAFDLSPDMICHARATRPHPRVRYATGDMREVQGGPYGLLLCIGNSLSLLESHADLSRFFKSACHALLPGGLIVTQTLNHASPLMAKSRIRVEQAALPDGEAVAVKRFLPEEHRTHLCITYLSVTAGGMAESTETTVLHHWSEIDLGNAADKAGLAIDGRFGAYDGRPISANSPDIILRLKK